MKKTFLSADGTDRCVGCHLHPCDCTCNPEHPARQILAAIAHDLTGVCIPAFAPAAPPAQERTP